MKWGHVWRSLKWAARGFVRRDNLSRASALSFDSILALVPILALAMATLKGLGAYDGIRRDVIMPWVVEIFGEPAGQEVTLYDGFTHVLELVESASLSRLGAAGLLLLLVLVWSLMRAAERTLDEIFGAPQSRPIVRTLVDYAAILFVVPIGVLVVSALLSGAFSPGWAGPVTRPFAWVLSLTIASLTVAFFYLVIPNRRVRARSALVGGLVAGLAGFVGFALQIFAQVGVARYNALYASFAAFPLFMIWVFVSWISVLYGAEVAAAHADARTYRWRLRSHEPDMAHRRFMALRLCTHIGEAHVAGEAPLSLEQLASAVHAPVDHASHILETLVDHGILVRSRDERRRPRYTAAFDIERVHVETIVSALSRRVGAGQPIVEDRGDRIVSTALEGLGEAARGSSSNESLRTLVSRIGEPDEVGSEPGLERGVAGSAAPPGDQDLS